MGTFGVQLTKYTFLFLQNKLYHNNSAKILSNFCLHEFSPKLNPIWEKRRLTRFVRLI